MVLHHCSTEIQSVWSVCCTVALVSNFLQRIADFGIHFYMSEDAEDGLAVKQCESDTQQLPARLAIVNGLYLAICKRADGRQFARAAQGWHQPRAYHWRRW
jgi:hypothetical protein